MYGRVESSSWLTPTMRRIVLGGPGMADFAMPPETDTYVNIALPPPDAPYGPIFAPGKIREEFPKEVWPARRRYTVRQWEVGRMTLDFVVHGSGVAGLWAAAAQPGDLLVFEGPGGGYRPDPRADWHLLVGDESAVPAIAASLETLTAGARAVVRLVCDGPQYEIALPHSPGVDLAWLHRGGGDGDVDLLVDSVRALDFPAGQVHAFVHGEADEIRSLRRHLLAERGFARSDMSCSPYWRRTMTDESWRQIKRTFVAEMESDVA